MVLDYASAGAKRPFAMAAVTKLVLGLSMLAAAIWLVDKEAYEKGYVDGILAERARNTPPPTPLSELMKKLSVTRPVEQDVRTPDLAEEVGSGE